MRTAFYKIFQISSIERRLFLEASLISLNASISLLLMPFSLYSKRLGYYNKEYTGKEEYDQELVLKIQQAVKRSAAHSLWRNKCLEQAVTAKKMLKKRGITSTLYFGVKKTGTKLEAHAWLKTGDFFVVGQRNHQSFTVVANYS